MLLHAGFCLFDVTFFIVDLVKYHLHPGYICVCEFNLSNLSVNTSIPNGALMFQDTYVDLNAYTN